MHRVHTRTTAVTLLLSVCLAGAGCTTTRTLPRPGNTAASRARHAERGDKVIVTLRSGEMRTFRVTAVKSDALVGKNVRIPFADVETLQRMEIREFSARRTVGLIAGIVVVAAGAWVATMIERGKNSD